MQTPEKRDSPILFGCIDDVVWIRVEGKGSFEISPHMKEFASREIEGGKTEFVVDLENCPMMDSTFMGTLLGIATILAEVDGELGIVNANERNVGQLRNLGLDLLVTLDVKGERWGSQRPVVSECFREMLAADGEVDRKKKAEVMLEAHEALAGLNEKNAPMFRDVIEYLKHDLHVQGS